MKMAKATERDIDAAGNAMSILQTISGGYFPSREGEEDAPTFFDPDDRDHLRRFYDMMNETLDASPGWPGRVIGGMCYVILYDKNQIVDPDADVIELHPRFSETEKQRDDLINKLDTHQRQAAIGKAIERACGELPEGFDLHIECEKDAGTVRLYHPDGEEDDTEFHDSDCFSGSIDNAINVAIAKGGE